jgi:hypothetical protein
MSQVLKDIKAICDLTGAVASEIKPVSFGNSVAWNAGGLTILAQVFVPPQIQLVVTRAECYVYNNTSGAADYRYFEPVPEGTAYWGKATQAVTANGFTAITNTNAQCNVLMDTEDLVIFPDNVMAALIGNLSATSDGGSRLINTKVYGYFVGAEIVARITPRITLFRAS